MDASTSDPRLSHCSNPILSNKSSCSTPISNKSTRRHSSTTNNGNSKLFRQNGTSPSADSPHNQPVTRSAKMAAVQNHHQSNNNNHNKSDTKFFVVERVMEHRVVGGEISFKIRWAGYSHRHDSWEPGHMLIADGIQPIIEAYLKEQKVSWPRSTSNNIGIRSRTNHYRRSGSNPPSQSIHKENSIWRTGQNPAMQHCSHAQDDGKPMSKTMSDMYSQVKMKRRGSSNSLYQEKRRKKSCESMSRQQHQEGTSLSSHSARSSSLTETDGVLDSNGSREFQSSLSPSSPLVNTPPTTSMHHSGTSVDGEDEANSGADLCPVVLIKDYFERSCAPSTTSVTSHNQQLESVVQPRITRSMEKSSRSVGVTENTVIVTASTSPSNGLVRGFTKELTKSCAVSTSMRRSVQPMSLNGPSSTSHSGIVKRKLAPMSTSASVSASFVAGKGHVPQTSWPEPAEEGMTTIGDDAQPVLWPSVESDSMTTVMCDLSPRPLPSPEALMRDEEILETTTAMHGDDTCLPEATMQPPSGRKEEQVTVTQSEKVCTAEKVVDIPCEVDEGTAAVIAMCTSPRVVDLSAHLVHALLPHVMQDEDHGVDWLLTQLNNEEAEKWRPPCGGVLLSLMHCAPRSHLLQLVRPLLLHWSRGPPSAATMLKVRQTLRSLMYGTGQPLLHSAIMSRAPTSVVALLLALGATPNQRHLQHYFQPNAVGTLLLSTTNSVSSPETQRRLLAQLHLLLASGGDVMRCFQPLPHWNHSGLSFSPPELCHEVSAHWNHCHEQLRQRIVKLTGVWNCAEVTPMGPGVFSLDGDLAWESVWKFRWHLPLPSSKRPDPRFPPGPTVRPYLLGMFLSRFSGVTLHEEDKDRRPPPFIPQLNGCDMQMCSSSSQAHLWRCSQSMLNTNSLRFYSSSRSEDDSAFSGYPCLLSWVALKSCEAP